MLGHGSPNIELDAGMTHRFNPEHLQKEKRDSISKFRTGYQSSVFVCVFEVLIKAVHQLLDKGQMGK